MSKQPAHPNTKIAELYGLPTFQPAEWADVVAEQNCPFTNRRCSKTRKSQAALTIGTCTVLNGESATPVMICPNRFLERQQVFIDCLRLLTNHELGNELRIVSELEVPGGSVDYCLASVRDGKAKDFVGIEIQTLDTTGTVWPERQRFLRPFVRVSSKDTNSTKPFGMNWKMTAKTVLMQLHHKAGTFEHLGKRLVVVLQDGLLADMRQKFTFGHIAGARDGDTVHFHSYRLARQASGYRIEFADRVTTDSAGIAKCLGLQAESKVELEAMFEAINLRLSESQLLTLSSGTSPSS